MADARAHVPASQNPSPMADRVRAHRRAPARPVPGQRFQVPRALCAPVQVYVPAGVREPDLLVHFHGNPQVVEYAAYVGTRDWVVATVDLGAGSAVYEGPLSVPGTLAGLVAAVRRRVRMPLASVTLSAFSAGYGAVRAVLGADPDGVEIAPVDAVLLLDGLHTGYEPDATPLAAGGRLEAAGLEPFVRFCRRAMEGEKRFLLTHSAVFPGTFASTTECADFLLDQLGLDRAAILQWGPLGMQQVSQARSGNCQILTFAGNSAPDHVDHLHALFHFLHRLWL